MRRHSVIDIETDRAFQERLWTFQRFAWLAMAALIAAALLGATGSGGPLAHATAAGPGGAIEYPRIARWQAADEMTVTLPPSASGLAEVELSGSFTSVFTLDTISPSPSKVVATGAGYRFTFDLGPGGGEKTIAFSLRAGRPAWPAKARVRIGSAAPILFTFVVLP